MPHHLVGSVHPRYRNKLYVRETVDGTTIHRTGVYAATGTGPRRIFNYLSFAISCTLGFMRARRPDFVFIESPPLFLAMPGILYCRIVGAKAILNVSDLWPDSVVALGVLRRGLVLTMTERLERWAYNQSRFVNAVTEGIKGILEGPKGVASLKILYLPNGVDTDTFSVTRRNDSLAQSLDIGDREVVLYAGTHGVAQGLETLVEAAQLLRHTNVVFLFVGDGSTKRDLRERVDRLKLENVRFVDSKPLAEMPQYYSLALASIVPLLDLKLFESARPSKLFPSLACGVPVIFCGAGDTAQFVRERNLGLIARPGSASELADAILQLQRDKDMRDKMSARARRIAVEEFDWTLIVRRWLEAMQSHLTREGLSPGAIRSVSEKTMSDSTR